MYIYAPTIYHSSTEEGNIQLDAYVSSRNFLKNFRQEISLAWDERQYTSQAYGVIIQEDTSGKGVLPFMRAGLAPISGICAHGSPDEERGFQLDFASTGLVLGTQTVALALDGSSPMKSESLDTVIQNAPVVVRLELGAVSMTAAEWSRLAPGDVVKSGQPVGSAVNLSVSGVSVARGELENVDGEIGVRIAELPGK